MLAEIFVDINNFIQQFIWEINECESISSTIILKSFSSGMRDTLTGITHIILKNASLVKIRCFTQLSFII